MRTRPENAKGGTWPPIAWRGCGERYWQTGAPSFWPVIGGVALPTKIPQVFVVALLLDVAAHPVPVAEEIDTVFPAETL